MNLTPVTLHIDMHYASALFRYQKEFVFKYREHTVFACIDDKHKVKVGELGYPVAMVERGKSVLVGSRRTDFHGNRSKCDKSVKFGTKLYFTMLTEKRRDTRNLNIFMAAILDFK